MNFKHVVSAAVALSGLCAGANAQINITGLPVENVNGDIAVDTTFTNDRVWNLNGLQVYVTSGAVLTIEPGTVIASVDGGSIAVARGAQIIAEGTKANPIIFTSDDDVATWTDGTPKSGTWRASAQEWGNLTIMGQAYISENGVGTNVSFPDAGNYGEMEGLVAAFPGDTRVLYGGGDDDDDSGSLKYVSFRYGGKVVALTNELNGLSLGGVGRGTDVDFVEIMNNVDDGIEVWGGTVNFRHFSIWNIGDDSFDVDQGWRGKAQFGLVVQGYSLDAKQGSGVGDNGFEIDGAEDSDWQPVTTASIRNVTAIGQPGSGDGLTAWRDGARVQYRQSIFMDSGDEVLRNDGDDGDGASGYGHNGTLTWAQTFGTAYNAAPATPNDPPAGIAGGFYAAQVDGNLSELTDSVLYNNNNLSNDAFGISYLQDPANNNVESAVLPIRSISRAPAVFLNGFTLQQEQVIGLDPRAANDALTSVSAAPADAFFDAVSYRGAFAPTSNWLSGWSASSNFGFVIDAGEEIDITGLPTENINGDIAVDTVLTNDRVWNLNGLQVYVASGATLTIEPGTVIASVDGGSIAVTRGAQIIAEGTCDLPIIFTSDDDVATWTDGTPKSGTWRASAQEWGNLTIMGQAYISENGVGTNVSFPDAGNYGEMEGLVAAFPGDTRVLYGGGDDDDDSGSLKYVSFRYGGKVVALTNELNGLSLGGVGRGTDVDFVEIMNNVDDGIEVWGGTVNFRHFSIWNIGDDSFDVDQGWRGKAQFGLVVQGYSLDAKQGSGVGDNGFEIDGAEDSDWQPVTTASIRNVTAIGQPGSGDGLTAWRDGARVQYRQSIFMDSGDEVLRNDGDDGDGASGYGHNGTLTWAQTFGTAYNAAPATPNDPPAGIAGGFYAAQVDGNLSELTDSVLYNNNNLSNDAFGISYLQDPANNNVESAVLPIRSISRAPAVFLNGFTLQQEQVIGLDPRAANDALTSVSAAPADPFFDAVSYRGAFDPIENWLAGWSASSHFGFLSPVGVVTEITSPANAGTLTGNGEAPAVGNSNFGLTIAPSATCGTVFDPLGYTLFLSTGTGFPGGLPLPNFGCGSPFGSLLINPSYFQQVSAPSNGAAPANFPLPLPANAKLAGVSIQAQGYYVTTTFDVRLTQAVDIAIGIAE